jgi:hypothetical protein
MSNRSLAILVSAAALAVSSQPARATNMVANGSFELTSELATKGTFSGHVTGWSGGSGLTFLDYPGTATTVYLAVYPGFPSVSPDGGNFVEADGDPSYSSAFYQSIAGLTIGQTYTLTFWQGSGQQNGFTGPTTEQWSVSFGGSTLLSSLMSIPQGAYTPWQQQSMTFTAAASSQVLSFLAKGTPNGAPPISFLDGVDLEISVPEPATDLLLGAGFLGLVAIRRYSRTKRV